MKLPIFAFCEGDMEIFNSVEEAVSYIEPIDVHHRLWVAFDSAAVPLRVSTARAPKLTFARRVLGSLERTIIEEVDEDIAVPEKLRQLICENLESIPNRELLGVSDAWLAGASLDEMVLKATSVYRNR